MVHVTTEINALTKKKAVCLAGGPSVKAFGELLLTYPPCSTVRRSASHARLR